MFKTQKSLQIITGFFVLLGMKNKHPPAFAKPNKLSILFPISFMILFYNETTEFYITFHMDFLRYITILKTG